MDSSKMCLLLSTTDRMPRPSLRKKPSEVALTCPEPKLVGKLRVLCTDDFASPREALVGLMVFPVQPVIKSPALGLDWRLSLYRSYAIG